MKYLVFALLCFTVGCSSYPEGHSLMPSRVVNILADTYTRSGDEAVFNKVMILLDEGTITEEQATRILDVLPHIDKHPDKVKEILKNAL